MAHQSSQSADSRQPTADSRQPTADSRQPTADSRQPTIIAHNNAERNNKRKKTLFAPEIVSANGLKSASDRGFGQNKRGLAKQVNTGMRAVSAVRVGAYGKTIDQACDTATQKLRGAITTQSGQINQSNNLDGFIAEHHHANSFNIDAVIKGKDAHAHVQGSNGKNSVDVVIRDKNGNIVRRYQSKYGKDANATKELFKQGDYRGQRKLVPKGQSKDIPHSTETVEYDGVTSKPTSKEEAKGLQELAQKKNKFKEYEWKDGNRTAIAGQVGKQALQGAAIAVGIQGLAMLGRRGWNSLVGKTNQSAGDDWREFGKDSVKVAAHAGGQSVVSGGLLIACRSGWLGSTLKATPAGRIAGAGVLLVDTGKIFYAYSNGEVGGTEALNTISRSAVVTTLSLTMAADAAVIGASIGTILGPAGTFVGGLVGGFVGGVVGGKMGELICEYPVLIYEYGMGERVRRSREHLRQIQAIETAARARIAGQMNALDHFIRTEIPQLQKSAEEFFAALKCVDDIDALAGEVNRFAGLLGKQLEFNTMEEFDSFMGSDHALAI